MNQREDFEDVCALASTRQWFEKAIEYGNGPVYLITGFRTFVDMNIDQRNTQAEISIVSVVGELGWN
jgi:hypothetical protein